MIDAELANYTIGRMCRLLKVGRRRYYEWRQRKAAGPTRREQRTAELTEKIKAFHKDSDGIYGAPRIVHDLREHGETVSVKTVAKAMRQAQIAGISPRTGLCARVLLCVEASVFGSCEARAEPKPTSRPTAGLLPQADAMRAARSSGKPAVVSALTDEGTLVTANPETGEFSAEATDLDASEG